MYCKRWNVENASSASYSVFKKNDFVVMLRKDFLLNLSRIVYPNKIIKQLFNVKKKGVLEHEQHRRRLVFNVSIEPLVAGKRLRFGKEDESQRVWLGRAARL